MKRFVLNKDREIEDEIIKPINKRYELAKIKSLTGTESKSNTPGL